MACSASRLMGISWLVPCSSSSSSKFGDAISTRWPCP
jgi:hypothetical protein